MQRRWRCWCVTPTHKRGSIFFDPQCSHCMPYDKPFIPEQGATKMATEAITRTMTTAQRGNFKRFSKSIFNKAMHVVGHGEAEELERSEFSNNVDEPVGEEVQAFCRFREGEVVYTVVMFAHRGEEVSV